MAVNENCLDNLLTEVGDFGKYQRRICVLIMVVVTIGYFPSVTWIFETKQVNYRCQIPECESDPAEFNPSWWSNAIPSENEKPAQCFRYQRINNSSQQHCQSSDFNKTIQERCDTYVYETSTRSILQDFDLHCKENLWKLTLVGTLNSAGLFVGLPIAGFLSDKYGRKTILIGSVLLSAVSGLIRSFTNSYTFFTAMEILDAVFRSGSYPTAFILGVELVGPTKRVLVCSLISSIYGLGGAIVGGVAWLLLTWRPLLQILYSIPLVVLLYYWLIPESVRWLLAKKRYTEAQSILQKLALTNGKTISEEAFKQLCVNDDTTNTFPLIELFKSLPLTMRLVICSVCWIICVFVYQGLTLYSVALSGNSYLDFILTTLVEIPGGIVAYFVMDRIGRRLSLSGGFLISGLSCISYIFVPEDLYWLRLCLYLLGKFGTGINVAIIYTMTSEIFPTPLRNSLLSTCSMFGRIGSMVAPQMPLLKLVWEPLPLLLFGTTSFAASLLVLLLPETMNTKLPDTIMEANNIGKKERQNE